jgi:hypothetical protein
MIVERKQYGCVQVLLVQIGLALYLIVIFLGTGQTGAPSKPQILRIQKVAEVGQHVSLANVLPSAQAGIAAYPALGAPVPVSSLTATDTETEKQILALLTAEYIAGKTQVVPIKDIPVIVLEVDTADQDFQALQTIHIIGSKPRAPSVIA